MGAFDDLSVSWKANVLRESCKIGELRFWLGPRVFGRGEEILRFLESMTLRFLDPAC